MDHQPGRLCDNRKVLVLEAHGHVRERPGGLDPVRLVHLHRLPFGNLQRLGGGRPVHRDLSPGDEPLQLGPAPARHLGQPDIQAGSGGGRVHGEPQERSSRKACTINSTTPTEMAASARLKVGQNDR